MKRQRQHKQRGAVALIVALSLVAMIGFLGLVVDLGRLYINKSELANAADACALAAARELGVQPIATSLERAVAAGVLVGGRNRVDFQGNPVTVNNADVTFSQTLAGGYASANAVGAAGAAAIKYARCELPRDGILPWFMQVLGIGAQTVSAQAVASQQPGQTSCGLPIGLCRQSATSCPKGGVPDAYGFCKGEWYGSKFPAGGGFTGSFNLIDYTPPAGGASELEGILTGAGQCQLTVGVPVGQTGVQQSLSKAWNTRFGIYQGALTLDNATPDYTGHAYTATSWTSKYNAFAGAGNNFKSARAGFQPYQGDAGSGLDKVLNGASNSTSAQLRDKGGDRRLAVVPIVDCEQWKSSQTTKIQAFACVLMLHPMTAPKDETFLEYLGLADEPGNPCVTQGMPGSSANVGPRVPGLVR